MSELTQALERAETSTEQASVLALLARSKPEIARALPGGVDFDRFERIVRTEVRRVPALLDCDPHSFLAAVLWAAQLNLEPGPLQHVHLIPFKRQVTFVIGYRGYVELAYRSGQVKDIYAALVREGDGFRETLGTSPKLIHEPQTDGEIVAAYAVARLKTGGTVFQVIHEPEWERARKASQLGSAGKGPWADDRDAMIRKTALRRLEPWLPKTGGFGEAIALDERPAAWDTTVDEAVADGQVEDDA